MAVRKIIRKAHKWLSLALVLFWAIQIAAGTFLVFHREIDELTTTSGTSERDFSKIDERLSALGREKDGQAVTSLFLTSDIGEQFSVTIEDESGAAESVRIDGAGKILLRRSLDAPLLHGGIYMTAYRLHRNLLSGEIGAWVVGMSGILLLANILLGLKLAWPVAGQWRRALLPRRSVSAPSNRYALHRACGLWGGGLGLVLVFCGVLLAFERGTAQFLNATTPRMPPAKAAAAEVQVAPSTAIAIASALYPRSEFSGLMLPFNGHTTYAVHLRQKNEPKQIHGATRVYIDGANGEVLSTYDATQAEPANKLMDLLLPIHSGQIGGFIGRGLAVAIGLWFLTMIALGALLWNSRSAASRKKGNGTGFVRSPTAGEAQ